jgi:hypothetical protein
MSGATLHHDNPSPATIPRWPIERVKSVERLSKTSASKRRATVRLASAPRVPEEVDSLYNACLINDVGWWSLGVLALLRTLATMGYATLADAMHDREVYRELAAERFGDTGKHLIKPYNLGLYLDTVPQGSPPVNLQPLPLVIAQLQATCHEVVATDARKLLESVLPRLERRTKGKGALADHADDVARLRDELAALVHKLDKSKRAAEALQKAAL